MPEADRFAALVATVGAFHVTDRAMRRAQERAEQLVAAGSVSDAERAAYYAAVRRYFTPYEREARAQLAHVDRELARLYQLQYNFTAERGVVQRRIEATQGVLAELAELAPQ